MRLSVIVVNWNLQEELAACLDSLRLQSHPELEVIVVDNGSHDGSAALVQNSYPECTLVAESENLGFAEGCNRGIAVATGDWIAMLNNDAVADPTWAAELMKAAETGADRVGMLQSLMLFKQRPDTTTSRHLPEAPETHGSRTP